MVADSQGESRQSVANPVQVRVDAPGVSSQASSTDCHEPQATDFIAVEEPLEVRVRGSAIAVLMRMPGRERDLVAGFLAAERILTAGADLAGIEPCADPQTRKPEPNIWNVGLADGVAFDPRARRWGTVSTSCGLCGAQTLEDLQKETPELVMPSRQYSAAMVWQGFRELRRRQVVFEHTAGVHAAALMAESGSLLDVAEDVGRHNAVDKVLGACLRADNYPLEDAAMLLVSGRISFEIVQKAALAGISSIAGVSAPTSLAIEAAERFNQYLFGFAREASLNQYTRSSQSIP